MGKHRKYKDGTPKPHRGVDILAPKGTKIKSVTAGKVIAAGTSKTFGYYVLVRGENESGEGGKYTFTLYAHLEDDGRAKGEIAEGDEIGIQGNSGNAKGIAKYREHVHIEVSIGDDYQSSKSNRQNPLDYFDTKFDDEGNVIQKPEQKPNEVIPPVDSSLEGKPEPGS